MTEAAVRSGPREIFYRLRRNATGHFPGAHRNRQGDNGFEFRAHRPLQDGGDARRLDIHASLRDPLRQWWVRVHSQRTAVPVVVLADLSASMGFVGQRRRADVLADLTESIAWSACRAGDGFAFIGADSGLPGRWHFPLTRQRGAGISLAAALRQHDFSGPAAASADGLRQAHRHLPRQRSLVFLIADFHWPDTLLTAVMDSLAGHDVVPVVLWDRMEFELPSRQGLAWLTDSESGERRLLWVRQALRRRWRDRLPQAREALEHRLQPWRAPPLFLLDGFDAHAVTAHFHG